MPTLQELSDSLLNANEALKVAAIDSVEARLAYVAAGATHQEAEQTLIEAKQTQESILQQLADFTS